jgi:hypothetical protein
MSIAFSAAPVQGRSFDVNATGTSYDPIEDIASRCGRARSCAA